MKSEAPSPDDGVHGQGRGKRQAAPGGLSVSGTDGGERSTATLKDVAVAAGVSMAAASKVLNNRQGVSKRSRMLVMQAAYELGYLDGTERPGGVPLSSATLLTLERMVNNDAFYGEMIEGIVNRASADGIAVEISIMDEEIATSSLPPWMNKPSAVILMGMDRPDVVESIHRAGVPAVLVNGMDRRMRIPSVSPDYHFGGWAAAQHLIDLGHRDIVHVTHVYRESIRRRLEGFCDALEGAQIPFDPSRQILDLGSPRMFSIEARSVVAEYLERCSHMPTAFVCVSDVIALGTIQALHARGLSVPGDVSVVGFDGLSVGAHSAPSLTTMQIDRRQLGMCAVDVLIERTKSPLGPVKRVGLDVELIVRQSSGPAPQQPRSAGPGRSGPA